jgi:sarcosine/dimethylglycine N-methyltransferase
MGGPARWLAHRIGCRVTGLDVTASRVDAARRLTRHVNLHRLVDFVAGDATAMPLPDGYFDVVVSQEAFLHIPDKAAVIGQCARVLKAHGTLAFTDVVLRVPLSEEEEARMAGEMQAPGICPVERYLELLAARGCTVKQCEDLSEHWARVLATRLYMYRSLRDTTVAKFGEAHFAAWDRTYGFFVGLFMSGKLGGARIVAVKTP